MNKIFAIVLLWLFTCVAHAQPQIQDIEHGWRNPKTGSIVSYGTAALSTLTVEGREFTYVFKLSDRCPCISIAYFGSISKSLDEIGAKSRDDVSKLGAEVVDDSYTTYSATGAGNVIRLHQLTLKQPGTATRITDWVDGQRRGLWRITTIWSPSSSSLDPPPEAQKLEGELLDSTVSVSADSNEANANKPAAQLPHSPEVQKSESAEDVGFFGYVKKGLKWIGTAIVVVFLFFLANGKAVSGAVGSGGTAPSNGVPQNSRLIGSATHTGRSISVYDENGRLIFGLIGDSLQGYTSNTVSVRTGRVISVYNANGTLIHSLFSD